MRKLGFFLFLGLIIFTLQHLLGQLKLDNTDWLATDHEVQKNKDFIQENFLRFEELILILELKSELFSSKVFKEVEEFENKISKLPQVKDLKSPLSSNLIIARDKQIDVSNFYDSGIKRKTEFEKELKTSLYDINLVNKERNKILISVRHEVENGAFRSKNRSEIISKIYSIAQDYEHIFKLKFSGKTYINQQIDELNFSDLKLLLSLSIIVILTVLYLIYTDFTKSCLITSSSIICLIYCLFIYQIFDVNITVINMVLPVLIIAISLSDSIFIISHADLLEINSSNRKKVLSDLIKRSWVPCFLTSLTTAIGFGSFYFSQITPLHDLAIISIPVILGSFIIILITNWFGIYFLFRELRKVAIKTIKKNLLLKNFIKFANSYANNHYKAIIKISFLCFLIFGASLVKMHSETNFTKVFFKKDSSPRKNIEILDQEFNGSSSVDLVVSDLNFKDIKNFDRLKDIGLDLHNFLYARDVISYIDVVSNIHQKFTSDEIFPTSSEEIEQELLFLEFSKNDKSADVLASYLNYNASHARFEIKTNSLSSYEIENLLGDIKKYLANKKFRHFLSGDNVYFHELSQYVIDTQIISVIITFSFIILIILFIFGPKIALLSVIPNFLPPLITLGTISLLNIPFDFSTILIASISFGITIDSSIHIIHVYKNLGERHLNNGQIREILLKTLGRPIIINAVIFSIIFGLFTTANLVLLSKFGIFSLLSILTSLLINLLLIPALIKKFKFFSG